MAANELNVHKWLDEYQEVLKDLGINSPEQIWSGDETGVQNVPKEQSVLGTTWTLVTLFLLEKLLTVY